MAVLKYTFTQYGDTAEVVWDALDGGDTGAWFPLENWDDNTVVISGTFNANTLTMQGAADTAGTGAFTLTDNIGLDITATASGKGSLIAEAPAAIRPSLGAGASSAVVVKIILRNS